ncbi:MAG: YraN family protein [Syntrophorhabdaceae bacterium]|nr:YraN family protein [Syntrophorhabdaceae bacterium]
MSNKRLEGSKGEESALWALKENGYRIIEKNYRSPFGELDIIAEEDGYLVFVEVKKRNSSFYGSPFEAVNRIKQRRIIKTAMFYMKHNNCFDRKIRFDVVGIEKEKVSIVKHAFTLE